MPMTCGQCEEAEALDICVQCGEDLCKACDGELHAKGRMAKHIRLPIATFARRRKCPDHKHEFMSLFCVNDRKAVCPQCLVGGKCQQHACKPIDAAMEDLKQRFVSERMEVLHKKIAQVNDFIETLNTMSKNVAQEGTGIRDDVVFQLDKIADDTSAMEEKFIARIKEVASSKLQKVDNQLESCKQSLAACKKTQDEAKDVLALPDHYKFFDQLWECEGRVDYRNDNKVTLEAVDDAHVFLPLDHYRLVEKLKATEFDTSK
eukprot:GFYU01001436.1.p1 GENE.GFYU01001436.1~~GFYU01001436.1.p1  ORF type:complete len:261 (+),score=50.63 GFYU01001436.1:188-970(+)